MHSFETGKLYATRGIIDAVAEDSNYGNEIMKCLEKYLKKDWGNLCLEDKEANEDALKEDSRILAKYNTTYGAIYIITEWNREFTTILFASEY